MSASTAEAIGSAFSAVVLPPPRIDGATATALGDTVKDSQCAVEQDVLR